MFSLEERIAAVKQLIAFDLQYTKNIRAMGYPTDVRTLKSWYEEYISEGNLHTKVVHMPKYTNEQKKKAVDYYISHGKNIQLTVRKLGYPRSTVFIDFYTKHRSMCVQKGKNPRTP